MKVWGHFESPNTNTKQSGWKKRERKMVQSGCGKGSVDCGEKPFFG